MNITWTRQMVRAVLGGQLNDVEMSEDPIFGFQVPKTCPDVPSEVLWPRDTWANKDAYDARARQLADMFVENFKQFEDRVSEGVRAAAPRAR
jgi:phosphoenolpyruvate carboxykinase (ATP)